MDGCLENRSANLMNDHHLRMSANKNPWHTLTTEDVSAYFEVNSTSGLDEKEARMRLAQFGPNQLHKEKREPIWEVLLEELREPLVLLLLFTGLLYAVWGELTDAGLIEAYGLAVDESSLTGESVPVEKEANLALPEPTPLAERRNLVFAGTTVTRGRGMAVAVATGMATELGRLADLVREVQAPRTPLQQAMGELSRFLVWLALAFSVMVPLLGHVLLALNMRSDREPLFRLGLFSHRLMMGWGRRRSLSSWWPRSLHGCKQL